jgi:nucleotide-binding universal stress UspA family protein
VVRTVLIGLDGSEYSTAASHLAIRWARRFGALLVGLGIVDEPTICRPEPVPIGASHYKEHRDQTLLTRASCRVEMFLERFALRCTEAGVAYKLLEDVGPPPEKILVEAQRYDLIVLGQQTCFRFATQEGPDETLCKVLKNTPRPVVAVPAKLSDGASVLVAYDGSLQAARALQAFQASGLGESEEVHVVSVGADHVEAARYADRAAEFLRFHEVKATWDVLSPSGGTAEAILEQASRLGVGLLVMGCYGQPTPRECFLGSVTRTVLKKSTVPLTPVRSALLTDGELSSAGRSNRCPSSVTPWDGCRHCPPVADPVHHPNPVEVPIPKTAPKIAERGDRAPEPTNEALIPAMPRSQPGWDTSRLIERDTGPVDLITTPKPQVKGQIPLAFAAGFVTDPVAKPRGRGKLFGAIDDYNLGDRGALPPNYSDPSPQGCRKRASRPVRHGTQAEIDPEGTPPPFPHRGMHRSGPWSWLARGVEDGSGKRIMQALAHAAIPIQVRPARR